MQNERKRVVIIGAGFGGLWVAKTLAHSGYEVIIIDKNNYHTFLPLLYQVSAAEIEPEQIASPVRFIVRKYRNIRFVRGEVSEISYTDKKVLCLGQPISFDYLVIAMGSVNNFFNLPGAAQFAFPLKMLDDGMILRNHILSCFERASFASADAEKKRLLTVVVVGGGPTGVEFSGALAELVQGPLRKDFPELRGEEISLCLLEASERLVSMFDNAASEYVSRKLRKKGVKVLLRSSVEKIDFEGVHLADGSVIETETVVWTAGVKGEIIKNDLNLKILPNGRIAVDEFCRAYGYPDVFIIGDLAHSLHEGKPLPMIAPVAIQQGKYVGMALKKYLKGKAPHPFRYFDKGSMVAIGRNKAVSKISRITLRGYFAWLIWIFIHILYLIGFRNKLFVMMNWVWNYLFFEKSVRLILPRCCDNPMHMHCIKRSCGEGCE